MKTTENFNLLSEEDKNAAQDHHKYYELVRKILKEDNDNDAPLENPRLQQLISYKEKIDADKKLIKINLRAEALDLIEETKKELAKKYLNPDLVGVKILNVGGDIAKKHKEFFDIPIVDVGPGTPKGYKIRCYLSQQYKSAYIKISVDIRKDGIHHKEDNSFYVYQLKNDQMTIEKIAEFEEQKKINVTQEIENAKKYFDYLKESQEKLEQLKKACNTYMLETITINKPFKN